jgi:hypothetical protein
MSVSPTCSFGSQDSLCGSVGSNSSILPLVRCDEDMTSHLVSLGVSLKRGHRGTQTTISESELILNRAGLIGLDKKQTESTTICPKHRRDLTLDWPGRKSSTCSHPSHHGQRRQIKNARRINATLSTEIFALHQVHVPIGSGKSLILDARYFGSSISLFVSDFGKFRPVNNLFALHR